MDYVIEPQDGKKGRSFRATCAAMMTANSLWDGGSSDNIRPVWSVFAGTEGELRPFMMNLKLGRKANPAGAWRSRPNDRVEFMKSSGFYTSWQREALGSLATIYHPELFRLDPGMVDPKGLSFILAVPQDWEKAQSLDVEAPVKHVTKLSSSTLTEEELAALVPTAYLFAAYLDRRTRCPIPTSGDFYLQILSAALHVGIATFPGTDVKYGRTDGYTGKFGFHAYGLEDVGISHAVACMTDHPTFEKFLAEEVTKYFLAVGPTPRARAPVRDHIQYELFETA